MRNPADVSATDPDRGPYSARRKTKANPSIAPRRGHRCRLSRARRHRRHGGRMARSLSRRRPVGAEDAATGPARRRGDATEGQDRRPDDGERAALRRGAEAVAKSPFGIQEVDDMSRTVSPSTAHSYGLALVCRVWECNRSTVYATRERVSSSPQLRKRGPKTEISDVRLLELIKETIEKSDWLGEGYRKVWAQLKAKGIFVRKRRVNRLMREANLLSPSRSFRLALVKSHEGRITTDRPDEMWG